MILDLRHAALEFIKRVLSDLLERRDPGAILSALDCPADWISVEGEAYVHTVQLEQLAEISRREPWQLGAVELLATPLGGELCLVSGMLEVRREDRAQALRLSALCRRTGEGLRVRQFHLSLPGENQAANRGGELLLRQRLAQQAEELAQRDRNMAALARNLPGGILCCDNTPELNLIEYSDGFLDLFGYTREEVHDLFHDQFSQMILPEDLESIWPEVHRQLSEGNTKEIEYRIRRKDGSVLWLLDRGQLVEREDGTGYFYCILIDETETRSAREALQASLERYEIISAQTNDIIFEWDLEANQVHYSNGWETKFKCPPIPHPPDRGECWAARVHPEDLEVILRQTEQIRSGMSYSEAEVRLADGEGRYLWCRVRVTLQCLERGRRRAVGVIVDIDAAKRQNQKLRRMAEQDALTGIFNKGATQALICRRLEETAQGNISALLILDVDNFKLVNDYYGHLGGDTVLTDIAGSLRKLFRSEDIIGRIGGDEFCVFLSGVRNRAVLESKAQSILAMFHHLTGQVDRAELSCSIGIAVSPDDGEDYFTLFQNADNALYQAKEKGKNQYAFYQTCMGWKALHRGLTEIDQTRREPEDLECGGDFWGENLANYVFQVLYEAVDVSHAIGLLLEILGHQMLVSRVYVYEVGEGGQYMRNTYEWCAEGIRARIHELQRMDMEETRESLRKLKRDGVFYCRDVSQLPEGAGEAMREAQGARAMLHCAIRNGGELWGLLGFDDYRGKRSWTRKQVEALTLVSDIVGTFLIRFRAQERAERLVQGLAAILDHQMAWIFVIAPKTYELLYINHRTHELLSDMALGQPCHRAFFHRDVPCEDCPLKRLKADGSGVERVFSELLGAEVEARVNTIAWQGEDVAYLVSCLPIKDEERTNYDAGDRSASAMDQRQR